jgi:hypothetical protein
MITPTSGMGVSRRQLTKVIPKAASSPCCQAFFVMPGKLRCFPMVCRLPYAALKLDVFIYILVLSIGKDRRIFFVGEERDFMPHTSRQLLKSSIVLVSLT